MKSIIFLSFIFVFFYSCCSENEYDQVKRQTDDQGVVIATPYLWKKLLHKSKIAPNGFIIRPIYYKNGVVIPMTNDDDCMLALIDVDNGKTLWEWDDEFSPKRSAKDIWYYVFMNNLLIYQDGSRSYCLNMDDGSTFWKYAREQSFRDEIAIMKKKYFIFGAIYSDEGTEMAAYMGDIESGETVTPKIRMDFPIDIDYPDGAWGPKFKGGVLYLNNAPDNDHLLIVSHHEVLPDWTFNTYFSLYNAETEEWVWKKQSIIANYYGTFFSQPCIYDGKIYANIGCSIVCHDLATGKQLWRENFNNDFMFTGFIVEDGKVIGNCETGYAYGLDAKTGNRLWSVKTAGTGGRMSYLNGVVYFVGGSVRRLFAIEASTGKMIWKIDPHLLGEDYDAGFRVNAVYTLPAKGNQPAKVIALSDLYAYCFEAYR